MGRDRRRKLDKDCIFNEEINYEVSTKMKKVIILGGAGNGMVIAGTIDRCKSAEIQGFLNDVDPLGYEIGINKTIPVIGRTEEIIDRLKEDNDLYVISGYGGFTNPKRTLERLYSLNIPNDRFLNVIDHTAVIPYDYCKLGNGIFIAPLVQLSATATIGNHCSLFGNSFVGHDTVVGEFCHIATNAVVGAKTKIGKGVHIGINSCIRENVEIGDYSIIGMGAVVIKDVPPNTIVVGNPAKVLKSRED